MKCHVLMIVVEFNLKAQYLVTVIWSIRTNVPDMCCEVHWTTDEEDSVYLVLSAMHYRHMTFSLVWMCMIHLFEYFFMTGKGGGRRVKETSKLICTLCSGYQSHTSTGIYNGFCTNQFCRRQSKGWWILPPNIHAPPLPPPPTFLLFYLKNKN